MGWKVLGLASLLVLCLAGSPVFADSVQYSVTGIFSADVNSAPLSGPNGSYSISFTLPQNPTPDSFDATAGDFTILTVPIAYSFQCDGCTAPPSFGGDAWDVNFAGSSLGGMFVVEFLTGGHDYYLQFAGDTLFRGPVDSPTLLSGGPFDLTNAGLFELDTNPFVDLGSATISAQTVATPEPSTLALVLTSLIAMSALALRKAFRT